MTPTDISIPLRFNGEQPNAFGAPIAHSSPLAFGDWVGSIKAGGDVNCYVQHLTPHCNGTHTECVGHICKEEVFLPFVLRNPLMNAVVHTLAPVQTEAESYNDSRKAADLLITKEMLPTSLKANALIIRTLPNDKNKLVREWTEAPYFTYEAMIHLRELGVDHLLVDLPTIDRMEDGGKVDNHHIFFYGSKNERPEKPTGEALTRTITEMIYVPESLADGNYLMCLGIPPFLADAAPSRPVLYPA